jgi:hypothetical protein
MKATDLSLRAGSRPCIRRAQRPGFGANLRRARRFAPRAEVVGFPGSPSFEADFKNMLELATNLRSDPEQPGYHVAPRQGWINDPNGPLYYEGKYHL